MFGSQEAKYSFQNHTVWGKYKVKMFRNNKLPIKNFSFCSFSHKNSMRYEGIIPYPKIMSDDSCFNLTDDLSIGSNPKESEFPSIKKGNEKD